MGFLDRFKKTASDIAKEEIIETPWHVLSQVNQLKEIEEQSKITPVAIFKHSTRCGISRMVFRQFEKSYAFTDDQIKLYYLDLLENREVSNEVGYTFQVMHQSPQLIVLKDGEAVYHASHNDIHAQDLEKFIS